MHSGIYIYGTGGHSISATDILDSNNFEGHIFYIDPFRSSEELFLGNIIYKEIPNSHYPVHIAIGNNQNRKQVIEQYKDVLFCSIISHSAYISKSALMGKNVFIGNFAHIGPMVSIGDNCIINTSAIIEHECIVGNHCHIAVNATLAGKVKLGNEVFVGAGACLINNVTICSNVVIGAGAVVIRDITEPGVYVGVPGRKVS